MDLYARVNIMGGHSVRLRRGDLREVTTLDNDPIGRAKSWVAQGADRIHVVDLDAAAFHADINRPLICRLIQEVEVPVQVAGGVRSEGEVDRLIDAGAWRLVMGTAAIENQQMVWDICRSHPGKIAVSVDVGADDEVVCHGWTQKSGRHLEEVLVEMASAGAAAFLVAEAGRDPLLEAPNFEILRTALGIVAEPVVAAGGVRDIQDLVQVAGARFKGRGVDGVIVGRAVTHGKFTIQQAKEVLRTAVGVERDETVEPDVLDEQLEASARFAEIAEKLDAAADHARVAAQLWLDGDEFQVEERVGNLTNLLDATKTLLESRDEPGNG